MDVFFRGTCDTAIHRVPDYRGCFWRKGNGLLERGHDDGDGFTVVGAHSIETRLSQVPGESSEFIEVPSAPQWIDRDQSPRLG